MIPLILGISAFTFLVTRWLARPGNPLTAVDEPNHRSLHEIRTPKGGGLAIVVALLFLDAQQRFTGGALFPSVWALCGFLAIALVSFLDDRRPVPSGVRLLVHLLAAYGLVESGLRFESLPLPGLADEPLSLGLLALPATLVFAVWFTNLYNFMDGMDGFAGGMTVFGFGGCGLLAYANGDASLALLCLGAAAASCGFLAWNFPPARIFMGDVAAAPLGYLVALVTFLGVRNNSLDLWQPLLLFSPFWVDATVTLIRRLLKRERVWEAHRTHAYQRFAQAGWGHRGTTLAEYAFMGLMIGAAWLFGVLEAQHRLLLLLGVAALFVLAWLLLRSVEKAHGIRGTD